MTTEDTMKQLGTSLAEAKEILAAHQERNGERTPNEWNITLANRLAALATAADGYLHDEDKR
jgi:DNA-binding transcriptional MerR regulator